MAIQGPGLRLPEVMAVRISREGLIPQIEPGPMARRLGGVYQLVQRSGVPIRILNTGMLGSVLWSTSPMVRNIFPNILVLYAVLVIAVGVYMIGDLSIILPFQQGFSQHQSQRSERSPLKRDTEEILDHLSAHSILTDGGNCPECGADIHNDGRD